MGNWTKDADGNIVRTPDTHELALREWGESLTFEQKAELKAIHEAQGYGCAAWSEGQYCCMDWILGDAS